MIFLITLLYLCFPYVHVASQSKYLSCRISACSLAIIIDVLASEPIAQDAYCLLVGTCALVALLIDLEIVFLLLDSFAKMVMSSNFF